MSIEKKDFNENKKLPENNNVPNEAEKIREEIRKELAFFRSSEELHKAYPKVMITKGVKFLAERAEAFWLIDLVFSYQTIAKVKKEPFQVYELTVDLNTKRSKMVCTDGNENVLYTQNIEFTTFPFESIKLYYTDGTILLPSEY